MIKQFQVRYHSNKVICGSDMHNAGFTSSIKGAKQIIRNIRKNYPQENPHGFVVYDIFAGIDCNTGYAYIAYEEE